MTPAAIAQFNALRDFSRKAVRAVCYAPHTSLYFHMSGRVMACCRNTQTPIGNAQTQTLDEMWSGGQAKLLRRTLEGYDFSRGCTLCERLIADGSATRSVMAAFDRLDVLDADPEWPQQMEFSISNVCNLECVMCSGQFSSAIRAHREKLPPTQKNYSSKFIESLRKYLPHLRQARFLGGEPLLIREYYRIWEMLAEDAPHVRVHVTTNGTQYDQRVEQFMQKLNFSFAVSLDGATKKTVESIRVNANFDEQMTILKILRDYTRERKTSLDLTFCFMRQNWHEFGEFCLLADQWDCGVFVNTVIHPAKFAVHNLPPDELRRMLEVMEAQAPRLAGLLKRNRGTWLAELNRLRRRCERLGRPA
jgi:molybdenum cofactor biosynthesis enzyme MoaA